MTKTDWPSGPPVAPITWNEARQWAVGTAVFARAFGLIPFLKAALRECEAAPATDGTAA